MRVFSESRFLLLLSLVPILSCVSSRSEEAQLIPPRPLDCEMFEVGPVFIHSYYRSGVRQSAYSTAESLGYDRLTEVNAVYEMQRAAPGVMRDVLVGWDAVAWRWNDPACRRR